MPDRFSEIRSAVIDGRCLNPRFRKEQLQRLHRALTQNAPEIKESLLRDASLSRKEIDTQLWLFTNLVAEAYEELNPAKEVREEYAVAEGRGREHARQAVGAVVLRADVTSPTFIFSLMSVLVPAIAAGNCIVVQIEGSLLETPKLVLNAIELALDNDIFLSVNGDFEITTSMLAPCRAVLVSHTHQEPPLNPGFNHQINSDAEAPVVAIVERDANLELAAKSLVHARFGLGGKSLYAPDVVLVNEGVKRTFLSEVIMEVTALSGQHGSPQAFNPSGRRLYEAIREFEGKLKTEKLVNVLFSGSEVGTVADFEDRSTTLLGQKIRESCLAIHSVTSMDDAIDWTSRLEDIGAAYVFAGLDAAKYITQFIDSPACFVNHIPASLLFNPMASRSNPITRQGSILTTYTQDSFTTPKCIFSQSSGSDIRADLSVASIKSSALGDFSLPSISLFKRASKRPDIGFFEQGIITGGLMLLSSVAMGGFGFYYGVKMLRPFLVS